MQIETAKPFVRRGVTQLMYVGDDDAVDNLSASLSRTEVAIGVTGAVLAMFGKGTKRIVGAGAAAMMALRWYQKSKATP